ncbi:MAG TPA: peptidoglycan-binding protein [Stellaceae bacterium]|nr:peptidoglycan-binding protein [Stellaceae bacterium]
MAALQEGVSSPDVKKVQQQINEYYQASVVPESGEFDDATTKGVMRFQKDVKVRPTGIVDDATLKLLKNPPKIKAHHIQYNGQDYYLDEAEWKAFEKEACQASQPIVDGYQKKVDEVRNLWDAHRDARKETFFLIPAIVDAWGGNTFPSESVIKSAETAVGAMQTAIKSGDVDGLRKALDKGYDPIAKATEAMKEYRDKLYDGGEDLIKKLEMVRDGSVTTLEILAAVATGGASIEVTAAVMGSVGAYKEVLNQIDKASKTANFDVVDAFGNVLVSGALDATVGALMHDQGFCGELTESVAKKLGATALKKFGSEVVAKVAEKAIKEGLSKAIEKAIRDVVEACKPGSKMTLKKAAEDVADALIEGGTTGAMFGSMDKQLEDFGKNTAKYLGDYAFKGLGKVALDKAWSKGAEKIIEEATKRLAKGVLIDAADDPKDLAKAGDKLAEAISKDAKTNAALAQLVKDKKL